MMRLLHRSMATSTSPRAEEAVKVLQFLLLYYRAPRNAQNRYKQERSPVDALIAQIIGQLHLSPVREEGV